jgi:hypothetical protein
VSNLRLLPWPSPDGKPAFLAPDSEGGFLSRLADSIEAAQISNAEQVLEHSRRLLSDPKANAGELRYVATRLAECLSDVLRISESRGGRISAPDEDGAS